jgi:hypothetical protein
MKGGFYVESLFGLRSVCKSEKDEGWPFDLWLAWETLPHSRRSGISADQFLQAACKEARETRVGSIPFDPARGECVRKSVSGHKCLVTKS